MCLAGALLTVLRHVRRATTFLGKGVRARPRATVVLNAKLNDLTNRVARGCRVECRRVPGFPVSAMRKRDKGLVFNGLNRGSVVTVRKHFRFCRNCSVGRMAFPMHMVHRLNVGALFISGTDNNAGPSFTVNSLVVVASRVGCFPRRPLHNGGVPCNPHFPSVDRTCSGRLVHGTSTVTTRGNVGIRRNICVNARNPAFRAPTRCGVFRVLNTSTINVSAIPRIVITGRYKVGIFNMSIVASLKMRNGVMRISRRRIRGTTSRTRPEVARVVHRLVGETWRDVEARVTALNRFNLVQRLARNVRLGGRSDQCNIKSSTTILSCPTRGRILIAASLLVRNIRFSLICMPLGRLKCGSTMIGFSSVCTVGNAPGRVAISLNVSGHFDVRSVRRLCTNVHLTYRRCSISVIKKSASTSCAKLAVDVAYVNRNRGKGIICHGNTHRASLVYIDNSLNTTCVKLRLLRHRGTILGKNSGSLRPSFSKGRCLLRHRLGPRTHHSVVRGLTRRNVRPASVVSVSSKLSSRLLRVYARDGINYQICRRRVPVSCRATMVTRRFGVGLDAYTLGKNRSCRLLFAIPVTSRRGITRVRNIGLVNRVAGPRLNYTLVAHSNRRFRLGTRK